MQLFWTRVVGFVKGMILSKSRLGKRTFVFLLSITSNFAVSVRRVCVLRKGCVILLWHSLQGVQRRMVLVIIFTYFFVLFNG